MIVCILYLFTRLESQMTEIINFLIIYTFQTPLFIQIFGKNSQAYVMLDHAMYWNPRFAGFNLRYDYNAYVTPYDPPNILKDPVEASFKALRQMVPGIYTEMHRFPINENLEQQLIQLKKKTELEIQQERPSPYEVKQMRSRKTC